MPDPWPADDRAPRPPDAAPQGRADGVPPSPYASPSPPAPAPPPFEGRRSRRLREAAEAAAQASRTAHPPQAARPAHPTQQIPQVQPTAPAGPRPASPAARPASQPERHAQPEPGPAPEHPPSRIPPAVLPLLAVVLLVWSLATMVGDVRWGWLSTLPVGLASFSPLVVLPALTVIALAVRSRNWAAVALSGVAAVLPWTFMIGYMLPATAPGGPTVPLRAMLVTAHDGTADAVEITAAARTQAADLVVVTELSTGLAHDLTTAGLPRWLEPRYVSAPDGAPAASGIAIFSRYPVEDVEPLDGTQWPAVRARVVVNDRSVTLVAGHTGRPSLDRLDRWRLDLQIFGQAAKVKGPVLLLANLNATPWHTQFRTLVSGRLHDAGDILGRGMRPTWPAWSPIPLLPTDHALVAGAGVTSLTTVVISGTDHRALSVELQLPAP